jgi:hypothetical protein
MGQFDSDRLPSWVTHCYKYNSATSSWDEDRTWKLSYDDTGATKYRLRLLKDRFLTSAINVIDTEVPGSNSLNHDIFLVYTADHLNFFSGLGHSLVLWLENNEDMVTATASSNFGTIGYGTSVSHAPGANSLYVESEDTTTTTQISALGYAYKKIEIGLESDFDGLDYFWLEITFIGDYISPSSFNQNLNLTSRVEHDSQIVDKLNVVTSLTSKNSYTRNINLAGSLSLTVTGASGTETIATLTFVNPNSPGYIPFTVGQTITVTGIVPSGYNTSPSATVVASTPTSVSYLNTTTTAWSSGGTVALTTPVLASISGDLLETTQGSATGYLNLQSIPIIARRISSGDGEVYFNQPMTYNAMNKVNVQSSLPRASTGQGIITDNSAWATWKDTAYRFAIQNKKVGFSQADSTTITYDDTSSSTYNIKYASTLQFNPYDSTWQAGLVSEKTVFAGAEATAQSGYGGPTLVGNLPFLVRSADRKSVMNDDPGRVAFFNLTNTKGDQLQTDISFKVSGTTTSTSLNVPKLTITNLSRSDGGEHAYQEFSNNNNFLGLASDSAQMLADTGSIIALHEKTTKSATVKFSALRLSLFNEIASLSVKRPSTYSAVNKGTSLINILSYSLDRSATSDVLNIGDSAVTNLTTNITSDTLYTKINANHYGYVGSSSSMTATHNFYGDVGMFIDSGTTVAEGSTKYKLTLRDAATATNSTNYPLLADAGLPTYTGSSTVRLTTSGLIRSPSIDKIWDYFRRVVGGGTVPTLVDEASYNTVVAYDFDLFTEVSTIVSSPAISTYKPATSTGIFVRAATPKSLRQLEVDILKTRVNQTTVTNYLKDRKVDKGINNNDGVQITGVTATAAGGKATLVFSTQNTIISAGSTIIVTDLSISGYNGEYVVLASPAPTLTSVSYTCSATGSATGGVINAFIASDYGTLWQLSKKEIDYVDGYYKWSSNDAVDDHTGATSVNRSKIYLAADGTFQPVLSTSLFYLPLVSA